MFYQWSVFYYKGEAALRMGMNEPSNAEAENKQRYFRVPFVRPSDENRDDGYQKRGEHLYLLFLLISMQL